MQVKAKELGVKDQLADLELIIWGDNLHAPLVERIVELPMDIYGGAYHLSVKNFCLLSARSLPAHAFIAMAPGKGHDQDLLHESMNFSRALWQSLKGSSVANLQDSLLRQAHTRHLSLMTAWSGLAGRLNGRLRLLSNDADSWRFPVIRGRIRGHDLGFHFFDAPDDFSRTKLDLMFEGDRLYLHNTQGYFGAVPMSFTGAWPPMMQSVSQSVTIPLLDP